MSKTASDANMTPLICMLDALRLTWSSESMRATISAAPNGIQAKFAPTSMPPVPDNTRRLKRFLAAALQAATRAAPSLSA